MRPVLPWIAAALLSLLLHTGGLAAISLLPDLRPENRQAAIEFGGGESGRPAPQAEAVEENTIAAAAESTTVEAGTVAPASAEAATAEDQAVAAPAEDNPHPAEALNPEPANAAPASSSAPVQDDQMQAAAVTEPLQPAELLPSPDIQSAAPADAVRAEQPAPADIVQPADDPAAVALAPEAEASPPPAAVAEPETAGPIAEGSASAAISKTSAVATAEQAETAQSSSTAVAVEPSEPAVEITAPGADGTAQIIRDEPAEPAAQQQAALIPRVEPPPPAPPSSSLQIAAFLHEQGRGACFLAFPRSVADGSAMLEGFASGETPLARFQSRFAAALDATLALDRTLIGPPQCGAVEFVSAVQADASPLALRLANPEVRDGSDLVAGIDSVRHPFLSLYVVDDEGIVSDVSNFVTREGGSLLVRAPVHLRRGGSGKPQLLIALSTTANPGLSAPQPGLKAADVFPPLLREMQEKAIAGDVAIATFRVR